MTNIVTTSEVNPFDFYVQNKIDMKVLIYKILCGSIVTLIALRLNEALKIVADNTVAGIQEYTSPTSIAIQVVAQIVTSIAFAILFAIAARISMGERDMKQMLNVMSSRD